MIMKLTEDQLNIYCNDETSEFSRRLVNRKTFMKLIPRMNERNAESKLVKNSSKTVQDTFLIQFSLQRNFGRYRTSLKQNMRTRGGEHSHHPG
jgi:hypothetical protein